MRLTSAELSAVAAAHKPSAVSLAIPRAHQQDALLALVDHLQDHDRVKVVMACGTGKSLLQMWVTQFLGARRVLVLVPSLYLLKQVRDDWLKQNDGESWAGTLETLCVCSDKSIGDEQPFDRREQIERDEVSFAPGEFPTCTDPVVVNAFLDAAQHRGDVVTVIFCTYASAEVVGAAMAARRFGDRTFEVGLFDEAHKAVGEHGKTFGYALHDSNVMIAKRLFFTATPRVVKRALGSSADHTVASMDDEWLFGSTAYELSFTQAVKADIICPYKVIISVIDDSRFTRIDIEKSGRSMQANQFVLVRAMEDYGLKKVITYHSTVSYADRFHLTFGAATQSGVPCYHVSGLQSSLSRAREMRTFAAADMALVTNARCLTEGVDVPTVDAVAFLDPRKSTVDIVQAAGRAMRKSPGKTCGYVIVPLHVDTALGERVEDAITRTDFTQVIDVLRALSENDCDLAAMLRNALADHGGSRNASRNTDKLFGMTGSDARIEFHIDGVADTSSFDAELLFDALKTKILCESGGSWFDRCAEFASHIATFGQPPSCTSHDAQERSLGNWGSNQRSVLDPADIKNPRVAALNLIPGWKWSYSGKPWWRSYSDYAEFCVTSGRHPMANKKKPVELQLAQWRGAQIARYRNDQTSEEARLLNRIPGWSWTPNDEKWRRNWAAWCDFVESNGRRPRCAGKTLAEKRPAEWQCIQVQWLDKSDTQNPRVAALLAHPLWTWKAKDESFDSYLEAYTSFVSITGSHPQRRRAPDRRTERELAEWGRRQKKLFKKLGPDHERMKRVAAIPGWQWSVL